MPRRKTITNKVFVETAEKAVLEGKTPETALVEASQKAYGHDRAMPAVARQELGLDQEETRLDFGRMSVAEFKKAMNGQFPEWLGTDPKLRLEYMKTFKGTLETALITKQERHVVETDDTRGRSNEEIEHRLRHGKWPEDMTLDAEDTGKPN